MLLYINSNKKLILKNGVDKVFKKPNHVND